MVEWVHKCVLMRVLLCVHVYMGVCACVRGERVCARALCVLLRV